MSQIKVGALSLQGDFARHLACVALAGYEGVEVRSTRALESVDALILPGGESTTMAHLLRAFSMWEPLRQFVKSRPVWGACAGAILLAREVTDGSVTSLGALDITIARNAYGRQVYSFEDDIRVDDGAEEFTVRGAFIRAPKITRIGPGVETLSIHDGEVVLVRQGRILASTFHTELRDDPRLTRYFIERVALSDRSSPEAPAGQRISSTVDSPRRPKRN